METPAIDLSAGMVPKPPPPSGGVDLSAGLVPKAAGPDPQLGSLPTPPASPTEGTYRMKGTNGAMMATPYSQVHQALDQGQFFADKPSLQQYARDHAADPLSEDRVDQWLDKHPYVGAPLNAIVGAGTGVLKTATGLMPVANTRIGTEMQLGAATPTKGVAQGLGETGENVGEFFSGEELLGLLGKAGTGLGVADKLKAVTGLAQTLEKYPMIAKLLKIGTSAAKQGTVAAGQTYAKTGDAGAAAQTGLLTAGAGAAIEGVAAPLAKAGISKVFGSGAADVAPGTAEYAEQARGAAEPHLNAVSDAIDATRAPSATGAPADAATATAGAAPNPRALGSGSEIQGPETGLTEPGAQPGQGAAPPTAGAAQAAAMPRAIDVNGVLNTIHDFTGAADRLAAVNDAGYSAMDVATGGKFRSLNAEVTAAQQAMYEGKPGADELYKNKLNEMDSLLSSTGSKLTKDTVQAFKNSWRQTYQLRDFGNIWDRNLDGVPGSSQASQTQRGINGRGLMRDLQRAVKTYTRPAIEKALGPGRLDNLENIARLNTTASQRATFNQGLHVVASYLPIWVGGRLGQAAAGLPGEIVGGAAGAAMRPAVEKVLNVARANPRVGNFLTHAVEYGADPKKYGPMLATMIQQHETQASDEDRMQRLAAYRQQMEAEGKTETPGGENQ